MARPTYNVYILLTIRHMYIILLKMSHFLLFSMVDTGKIVQLIQMVFQSAINKSDGSIFDVNGLVTYEVDSLRKGETTGHVAHTVHPNNHDDLCSLAD